MDIHLAKGLPTVALYAIVVAAVSERLLAILGPSGQDRFRQGLAAA